MCIRWYRCIVMLQYSRTRCTLHNNLTQRLGEWLLVSAPFDPASSLPASKIQYSDGSSQNDTYANPTSFLFLLSFLAVFLWNFLLAAIPGFVVTCGFWSQSTVLPGLLLAYLYSTGGPPLSAHTEDILPDTAVDGGEFCCPNLGL